jgi:CBS domain-containing protein
MTSNPCAIEADKPVSYAAKMMRDEDVGFAPIVEGDKLVGVVAQKDVAEQGDDAATGEVVQEISQG